MWNDEYEMWNDEVGEFHRGNIEWKGPYVE